MIMTIVIHKIVYSKVVEEKPAPKAKPAPAKKQPEPEPEPEGQPLLSYF